MNSPFFILATPRSGSTSLCRILDSAQDVTCLSEPSPTLGLESRRAHDGLLSTDQRVDIVRRRVVPRIQTGASTSRMYGEKNVTYGPFIRELHDELDARFILIKRDGRAVARSLVDWNNNMFGSVYREASEPFHLTDTAFQKVSNLPVHLDESDLARPRPIPGDPLFHEWESLDRLSMCAYCWSTMMEVYLDAVESLPPGTCHTIDYTNPDTTTILDCAAFLGIQDLDGDDVELWLNSRINSLQDRLGQKDEFPQCWDWDGGMRRRFEAVTGTTMTRAGYWTHHPTRWMPDSFGSVWDQKGADPDWFEWMYRGREQVHLQVIKWIRSQDPPIQSVADFGAGIGTGYSEALQNIIYVGFDRTSACVEWASTNNTVQKHRFMQKDFVAEPIKERFDLVMSHGTIDNSYDIEAFLDAMIAASRRFLLLTCYRGWFPDREEHAYRWTPADGCFYNDVSPKRVREHLEKAGCTSIDIRSIETGRDDVPLETWICAVVPEAS